jgi:hypothetical protein
MAASAEERIAEFIKPFRVKSGSKVTLGYEELVVQVHPENLDRQKWAGQNGGQDLLLEQSAGST